MGRLRRGGARRSSTIFAATMFPRLAALTTDRTTPSTSDASNCSAKMVLLCRAPFGRPELPFANGRPRGARELIALGHDVRLMPAQYVKPYVKRGKNDAADAEAICEAVARPTMRFVAVKTPEQQSTMMLHRVRLMLNRQRTQLSNAMRAHMSEFGVVGPVGRRGLEHLMAVI